jgi:hypothetical protein
VERKLAGFKAGIRKGHNDGAEWVLSVPFLGCETTERAQSLRYR